MSLLGKKRTKRSEEDDKVINYLINKIILQEYAKLAGIKEEEEEIEEKHEEKKEENNNKGQNDENPEIKIIENTINISSKERIKNTTTKKESKNKKIEIKENDEHKKELFSKEKNKEKEEKKEIKKEDKENNSNIEKNPFSSLLKETNISKDKKDDKENKDENKSLFGNLFKEKQSLFGNNNKETTKSLFGVPLKFDKKDESNNNNEKDKNQTKEVNSGSIFGNIPLFSNNGGKSLFNNDNNNNSTASTQLLFSNKNNITNPFLDIKGDTFVKSLFSNKPENNQNKTTEKGNALFEGGDDGSDKSDENDKPKTDYVAEPLKTQSDYSKIFNLNIHNLFLYNKAEKKYISKGSGFFSFEKTKDEKQSVAVFRNHAGNKLVEGFLDKKFNKFDIFNKDFDYVVCFGIIMINEGKPDIGFIKIPFKNEETAKELKAAFEKALDFIKK